MIKNDRILLEKHICTYIFQPFVGQFLFILLLHYKRLRSISFNIFQNMDKRREHFEFTNIQKAFIIMIDLVASLFLHM